MVALADVFGVLVGIFLGVGLTLLLVVRMVKESNDIGDSKGEFYDFGDYLRPLNREDDLKTIY